MFVAYRPEDQMDLLTVLLVLLIVLAVGLLVAGLVVRRQRTDIKDLRWLSTTLRGGVQGIVDTRIPELYRSIDGQEIAVPRLGDLEVRAWLAQVDTLLEETGGLVAQRHQLDAQRCVDAEGREHRLGLEVTRQRETIASYRAGMWNVVGARLPTLLNQFTHERVDMPPMPDTGIAAWFTQVDRIIHDAGAAVTRQHGAVSQRQARLEDQVRDVTAANDALENALVLREEELRHLVGTRLPAVIEAVAGADVEEPGPWHPQLRDTEFADGIERILALVAAADEHAEARADERAKSAVHAVMRTVRARVAELEVANSTMQARHEDPTVLEGLLKVDHATSQLLRRIQAIAMLCGATSGAQRPDTDLRDVLRGAVSRIHDYQRVEITSPVGSALVGRTVEQVVLALAELLDNAARHSAGTAVHVSMQAGHNGVTIIIDDAGIGMSPDEIAHANDLLTGAHPIRISSLGDPPHIGLATCAVLVAAHGFRVYLDDSSRYGGVRAAVFLPHSLLTPASPPRHSAPRAITATAPSPAIPLASSEPPIITPGQLPIRRPGATTTRRIVAPAASTPPPERDADDLRRSAAGIGSWQRTSGDDRNRSEERTPS